MALALLNVFDESIVQNIQDLIPRDPPVEWETLYGTARIYQTKHYITYTTPSGPEGGYVYFYRERAAGWYKWHRDWFRGHPEYTMIEENVAMITVGDGSERIGVLPENWEEVVEFDEDWTVIIGDDDTMQSRDTLHHWGDED